MSDETIITAHYERKFSDGNYGSEGLSMSISQPAMHADVTSEEMDKLAEWLRHNVLTRLAKSESRMVAMCAREELRPSRSDSSESKKSEDLEELPF